MSSSRSILVTFAVPQEATYFRRNPPPQSQTLVTGMGGANARRATESVLARTPPSLVLTCGFAGGLNPSLTRGLVLFEADAGTAWDTALRRAGARPGLFHCASRVATSSPEKQRLRETTGADAVEMESAVIRELCALRGVPSATVRVISDEAGEDLPLDFNDLLTERQSLDPGRLAAALLRRPSAVLGLLRLQRHCAHAARRLASVLHAAVTELAP